MTREKLLKEYDLVQIIGTVESDAKEREYGIWKGERYIAVVIAKNKYDAFLKYVDGQR
jgi:hypothetical protein